MRSALVLPVLFSLFLLHSPTLQAETYKIDKDHSTVSFTIRHLVSNVTGTFNDFAGTLQYDPKNPGTWAAEATIQADSIDTNHEKRDEHLRTADFFDVNQFPVITFKSTGVRDADSSSAKLDGLLAIHGVEKPVTVDVKIHGAQKDPWGNVRSGFTGTTMINRKDFGLNWNQALETGGVLVGEEVKVTLEVEGILEPENLTKEEVNGKAE